VTPYFVSTFAFWSSGVEMNGGASALGSDFLFILPLYFLSQSSCFLLCYG
jgi:hypothetical protein